MENVKITSLQSKVRGQAVLFQVIDFTGPNMLIERLQELGFHRGLHCELIGRAPFAGPLLIRLGGTVVALRAEEADCLRIQTL